MKLEGGKWKRLSWDTAMGEISSKMQGNLEHILNENSDAIVN